MEVDRCLAILTITEAARHVHDLLNSAGELLTHGVGQLSLVVSQGDIDMSADGPCGLEEWFQATVGRLEAPPSLSAKLTPILLIALIARWVRFWAFSENSLGMKWSRRW